MYQTRNFIKITSASLAGGYLVLTPELSAAKTYYNGERIVFVICTSLPTSITISPVAIDVNGVNIPLQDKLGNTLQSDQIKSRQTYVGVWGTSNNGHIKLCTCTNRSQATPASITPESEG